MVLSLGSIGYAAIDPEIRSGVKDLMTGKATIGLQENLNTFADGNQGEQYYDIINGDAHPDKVGYYEVPVEIQCDQYFLHDPSSRNRGLSI